MDRVCYTCLKVKPVFINQDTQQLICQDCFRKIYKKGGRRSYAEQKEDPKMSDLMHKWNRKK